MPEPRPAGSKRPRGKYSRLICIGCQDRRIRCDLPNQVEVPSPGELRTAQKPCHRCKKLGLPCVIRQTILGRPGSESRSTMLVGSRQARIDYPSHTTTHTQSATTCDQTGLLNNHGVQSTSFRSLNHRSLTNGDHTHWNRDTLLIHIPQSTETAIIIRALDTIRYEHVEEEWFRHLPAHFGHTPALDLSVKAMVDACAYARGVPQFTSDGCFQALALALNAVQKTIRQSPEQPSDNILAATALLAPFEGVVKRNGIPTRPHIEGLAAILAARPATYPVTELARDILDFNACESAIMACIQDTPSPFESVAPAYFINNRVGHIDSDQAQLKALGNELFIRIPRLVKLVRSLKVRSSPQHQLLLDALELSSSLHRLQDSEAEGRLLLNTKIHPLKYPDDPSTFSRTLDFASIKDFEALAYYWQGRLSLLRLEWCLHHLSASVDIQTDSREKLGVSFQSSFEPKANDMFRLVKNILMSSEYAAGLRLNKHIRLLAHAMVVVWGVMMDARLAVSHGQDEERTNTLSDLLLRTVNVALSAKPDLTFEDMDIAADIFTGGQPKGRFAKFFGL